MDDQTLRLIQVALPVWRYEQVKASLQEIKELNAELDNLQTDLKLHSADYEQLMIDNDKLKVENERLLILTDAALKQQVEELETAKAKIEINVDGAYEKGWSEAVGNMKLLHDL